MKNDYILVNSFEYRTSFPENPVNWVILNSNGGSNQYATPVYDYIRHHKVNTIAEGTCQSFAFACFTAGEQRLSYPSTIFMVHGSKSINTSYKDKNIRKKLRDSFNKFYEIFWEPWLNRMEQISNKPREFWKNMIEDYDTCYYFSAQDLKDMGVVTEIIH